MGGMEDGFLELIFHFWEGGVGPELKISSQAQN